ncbi:hypothetical protein ACET3Z_016958 [Daucus carota]
MGSLGEKKTSKIDDFSNGLVWVRRRNGSWWPGRVLSPDELPESSSTPQRSGTPVKLLGRKDASVDWYNLQKSIRIKAFRCGEFEQCIESAKASATGPSKRGVKYARREDAILDALEIESGRQSKDQPDICSNVNRPSNEEVDRKESPPVSLDDVETNHIAEELISSKDKPMLGHELSHSGVSFQEVKTQGQSSLGMRRKNPNDSEDDGTEKKKRMRGIDDLGVGVNSSAKRKRSLNPDVQAFLKKRSRSRQLTKVLESTPVVKVPVISEHVSCPTKSSILGASHSKVSRLESIESKGSLSMVINNNSDSTGENGTSFNASKQANHAVLLSCKQKENEISSTRQADGDSSNRLVDVTLVGEDLAGFTSVFVPCATQNPQVPARAHSSRSRQVEEEELNETASTSSGASKWLSKGRRKLRTSRKSNGCLTVLKPVVDGAALISKEAFQIKSEPVTDDQIDDIQDWGKRILHTTPQMVVPKTELAPSQRLLPYRQSRYTMNPRYQSSAFTPRVYDPDSSLYEVKVVVEASSQHRPPHVPYTSVMSELTGESIIGYPLTVEVLGEGSFEQKPNLTGQKNPGRSRLACSTGEAPMPRKNGVVPKKTRKLSSITGSHRDPVKGKKRGPRKVNRPSLSCIPLNVVFSRINAAIN